MQHRTRWLAGFSAVLLALVVVATASAYNGQVAGSVTVAAHGTVTCAAPFRLTATILDANGMPVSGQSVAWSFVTAPSTSDRVNKTSTITNAQGVATATVTLGHLSGTRRIRATAGDVSASVVLSPSCGGGLPRTSTLATETTQGPAAPVLVILLALAFGAGGLTLRRIVSVRR